MAITIADITESTLRFMLQPERLKELLRTAAQSGDEEMLATIVSQCESRGIEWRELAAQAIADSDALFARLNSRKPERFNGGSAIRSSVQYRESS